MPWTLLVAGVVGVGCGGSVGKDEAGAGDHRSALGGEPSIGGASTAGIGGQPGTGGRAGGAGNQAALGGEPSTAGAFSGGTGGMRSTGGRAGGAGTGGTGGGDGQAGFGPVLFLKLDFDRRPAAGYCIQADQITRASIIYTQLGDYGMSGEVIRGWVEDPDCPVSTSAPSCHVSEPFQLMLSVIQIEELGVRLDAMPEDRCETDPMMECDPCLVATIETGEARYSDYCCGTQLSPGYDEAFARLAGFLDGLAPNEQGSGGEAGVAGGSATPGP